VAPFGVISKTRPKNLLKALEVFVASTQAKTKKKGVLGAL